MFISMAILLQSCLESLLPFKNIFNIDTYGEMMEVIQQALEIIYFILLLLGLSG